MEQFNFIVTTDVYWPNGLSLNRENERFYWIDAYLDKMESIFYNGTGRKLLIQEGFYFHPYDVVYYKGHVFWSSVFNNTMHAPGTVEERHSREPDDPP